MGWRLMADKVLSRIQTGHEPTDRALDQARAVINPALAKLQAGAVVTGSKGGNAALASLISALAAAGLITDKTT